MDQSGLDQSRLDMARCPTLSTPRQLDFIHCQPHFQTRQQLLIQQLDITDSAMHGRRDTRPTVTFPDLILLILWTRHSYNGRIKCNHVTIVFGYSSSEWINNAQLLAPRAADSNKQIRLLFSPLQEVAVCAAPVRPSVRLSHQFCPPVIAHSNTESDIPLATYAYAVSQSR